MAEGSVFVNGKRVEGRTLSFDMESGDVKVNGVGVNEKGEDYFDTDLGRVTISKPPKQKAKETAKKTVDTTVETVKKNYIPFSIGVLTGIAACTVMAIASHNKRK